MKVNIENSNQNTLFGKIMNKMKLLNLSNSVPKKIKSDLKFVYSENSTLSIIFSKNEDLLGVAGEFNNNIKKNWKKLQKHQFILEEIQ